MSDLAPVLGLLTAAIVIGAVLVIGTVAATRCDARPRPRHEPDDVIEQRHRHHAART
jgi:hypothetical protein